MCCTQHQENILKDQENRDPFKEMVSCYSTGKQNVASDMYR